MRLQIDENDNTIGYYKLLHDFKKYKKDDGYYDYWFVRLFDKFTSTIIIEGLDSENFKQENGEPPSLWNFWLLAVSNPTFAITKSPKGNYIFVTGGRNGNVMYSTLAEEYTFACPDYSDNKKISKDIWVGSLLTSMMPFSCILDYFADLLSECTKSLKVGLINTRLTKIFNSSSDKQKASIEEALNKVYAGEVAAFNNDDIISQLTEGGSGVEMFDLTTSNSKDLLTMVLLTQEEIYSQFCRVIGIDVQNKSKQAQVQEEELKGLKQDAELSIDSIIENLNILFDEFNAATGESLHAVRNEILVDTLQEESEDDSSDSSADSSAESPSDSSTENPGAGMKEEGEEKEKDNNRKKKEEGEEND